MSTNFLSFPVPKKVTVSNQTQDGRRLVKPSVTLERPGVVTVDKKQEGCVTFKLRSNPKEATSTTYELSIKSFNCGKPEVLLMFLKNIKKVFIGQNMIEGPDRFALLKRMLEGDALAAFDAATTKRGAETNDNLKLVLQDLIEHVFPKKALVNQKRWMRRYMRKSRDMTTREFVARISEINEYLTSFPPFKTKQKLEEDELIEVAEHAVPATWQKAMVIHGFDPSIHTKAEFIEFCERMEFAEAMIQNPKENQKGKSDSKPSSLKNGNSKAKSPAPFRTEKNGKKSRAYKWCVYHESDTHDTGDCKVMLAQAKEMRGKWENSKTTNYASKNKTWNKSTEGSTKNGKNVKDGYITDMRGFIRN